MYLGHSPVHAGSVALVLNLTTGHVSPQFHVVFDDEFSTVENLRNGSEPVNWKNLFESSREMATDEKYELAQQWNTSRNLKTSDKTSGIHDPTMSTTVGSSEGEHEGEIAYSNAKGTPSSEPTCSPDRKSDQLSDFSDSRPTVISNFDLNVSSKFTCLVHPVLFL